MHNILALISLAGLIGQKVYSQAKIQTVLQDAMASRPKGHDHKRQIEKQAELLDIQQRVRTDTRKKDNILDAKRKARGSNYSNQIGRHST